MAEVNPRDRYGPPSTEPCTVCSGFKNNRLEPRFMYTVCEDHQSAPPASISAARDKYGRSKKS